MEAVGQGQDAVHEGHQQEPEGSLCVLSAGWSGLRGRGAPAAGRSDEGRWGLADMAGLGREISGQDAT